MHGYTEVWKEVKCLEEELRRVASRKGINSPEAIIASKAYRNKMQEYIDLE